MTEEPNQTKQTWPKGKNILKRLSNSNIYFHAEKFEKTVAIGQSFEIDQDFRPSTGQIFLKELGQLTVPYNDVESHFDFVYKINTRFILMRWPLE